MCDAGPFVGTCLPNNEGIVGYREVWDVASLVEGLKEAAEDAAQSAADRLRSSGLNATPRLFSGL